MDPTRPITRHDVGPVVAVIWLGHGNVIGNISRNTGSGFHQAPSDIVKGARAAFTRHMPLRAAGKRPWPKPGSDGVDGPAAPIYRDWRRVPIPVCPKGGRP
ncbi:hypothetical protein SCA03_51020 [Streptomyces cacaoi]|uniref:Uncharacterized protein n=1 Tax=Streptomyces cacaoi TaxID=1898 RepID=A0A4Y3R4E1_STRCI|nr:hypothetical protein SCA03_51020 [Streptomyces cacaoi]